VTPAGPRAWTRRAALGAMAAAGLGFAVMGPRGNEGIPRGRLVLDYWEKWTGHEGAAMQRLVDDFNRTQPLIHVRYLVTSAIHQKAMIAILGGAPPDLLGLYAFNVPAYSQAGAVLALDDLARGAGLSLDHYAPGMRQVMQHAGGWFGVVNTAGTLALYWNRAIFRECAPQIAAMGLDPDRAPRTIEELDSLNRVISRAQGGAPLGTAPLERAGFLHLEPGWWAWVWGYLFGGRLYDPAADAPLADSPEFVRAYQWLQDCPRLLGVEHVERFRSGFGPYGTPQASFLTGEVAMHVQGPWMANVIRAFRPDLDYGVAPLPVSASIYDPDRPVTCIDTDVLMIPRGARHPEAAMEFIAFTQRQENVEALALAHGKGSPLARVSDAFVASHPNRGVRLHTELAASPRAFIAPPTPVWPEFKDLFDTAVFDMWKLVEPADRRLARVQARARQLFASAAAIRARRGERGGGA
jgi:multiple sugar transport system substrate-binding protein